ncbi:MAG: hypothetical protein AAGA85_05935 [Bacteroidota bacterium]
MISITSTNLDELKAFWRKIEGEYSQVEKIHISKDRQDYKMVVSKITRGEMSAVLRCVADKIFELDSMVHDQSFFEDFTYRNFLARVEDELGGARKYPGASRLTFIWKELTQMEKRLLHEYLTDLVAAHERTEFFEAQVS